VHIKIRVYVHCISKKHGAELTQQLHQLLTDFEIRFHCWKQK